MARPAHAVRPPAAPGDARWWTFFAVLGAVASSASLWVHYRLLHDPLYTSFCDVSSTFSCTEAYTSAYGMTFGVPTALVGVVFFAAVLVLIALCTRSPQARAHLPGYLFAVSTLGLAGVLYYAYASFVVLGAVCLLCVGSYVATIGLFLTSGAASKDPMTSLPGRIASDLRRLVSTPAALAAAAAFALAVVAAVVTFPMPAASAATPTTSAATAEPAVAQAAALPAVSGPALAELEKYLAAQPREMVMVPGEGAAVVIVKFNDYQCPPCGMTYREYKPILEKWQKQAPGRVKFVTKDYPLDPECNAQVPNGMHQAACEAAVGVRLAREKGKADAMEAWLFANQPSMTPTSVREAARMIGGVTDFEARYPRTLELVKGDIAQGGQLKVSGTPTFFMNGMRLPGLRPEFFDAAIAWELKRVESSPRSGGPQDGAAPSR
jgi:uncharacterized membrane protein